MVKINLLPDVVLERRKQARIRRIANMSLIGWTVLVLVVLGLAFGYNQLQAHRLEQKQAERDNVNAEANSPENVEFREEALAVQSSLDTLETLYNERQSSVQLLLALMDRIPAEARITEFNYGSDNTVRLGGEAASYRVVSRFEKALKESRSASENEQQAQNGQFAEQSRGGYFTNTTLSGVNVAGEGRVRFEMSTQYNPPRAAATDDSVSEEVRNDG